MSLSRWRRLVLAAACVSSVLLAACGGSSVVSQFRPSRVVAFGDAFTDVGQRGVRYTINDATAITSTERIAVRYGLTLTPSAAGGTSYAIGNARVNARPDPSGNAAVPSVKEQIDTFLAAGAPAGSDLVLVQGGIADILAETRAVIAGTQTADQALAAVVQAGKDLGDQVRRLTTAGATHVVVMGPYNLARSPWGLTNGQGALLETLAREFNTALKIRIVDLGDRVLYVDAELYLNLVTSNPSSYQLTNATNAICTSRDAGAGFGIGAGQVNAALCSGSTLDPNLTAGATLFADPVHLTPVANALLGDYAYGRVSSRW